MFVKQLGLQRSGTNALRALIEINWPRVEVLVKRLGNKHEPTSWERLGRCLVSAEGWEQGLSADVRERLKGLIERKELPLVVSSKEYVPWVVSYYRYQRRKVLYGNPEAEFPLDRRFVERVTGHWIEAMLSWRAMARMARFAVEVEHLQLLSAPGAVLRRIQAALGLDWEISVTTLEGYARRGTEFMRGEELIDSRIVFDPGYHLGELWRGHVPGKVLKGLEESERVMRGQYPELADLLDYRSRRWRSSRGD
jgi:hypothetical protein